MTNMTSESLHRHMPEPVSFTYLSFVLQACEFGTYEGLTFAHVLDVPTSEEVWPGEAVDLFLLPFFAKSPHTGMFVHQGRVFEHMRCEILRLCSGKYSAKDFMEDELSFYCEFEGAYPANFCDRCEDEDELLLDYPLDW